MRAAASFRRAAIVSAAIVLLWPGAAAAQPPDLSQMSGVPLPVSDVVVGTVTVRVIRGSLANVVTGLDVQLAVGGVPRTARTSDAGRAEFPGLPLGARAKATAVVDGQRLESQEFEVPASGGIRLMLVAAAPGGGGATPSIGAPTIPPAAVQPGPVVLGDQSRFVFEMGDEALTGFYILQVVNSAPTPVNPLRALTIELPRDADKASALQGSSPQGTVAGRLVHIAGPFPPGPTVVQVAFTLPYKGGSLTIAQPLPVPLAQVTLLVEKVGEMQVSSPQAPQRREVAAQGDTYILAQGPALAAGDSIQVTLAGLPHAPLWPRNVALGLALLIVLVGVWAAARPGGATAAWVSRRQKLDARRERLFEQLAALEEQQRSGSVDAARYTSRRAELVRSLERLYAEMDEEAAA